MGLNRKTPKAAMHYWCVGWNGVVIKARTARVAVRKWLRDNAFYYQLIRDRELDNPGGSGDMPHEAAAVRRWPTNTRERAERLTVSDVPVVEVPKRVGRSAPRRGSFWAGVNRRRTGR